MYTRYFGLSEKPFAISPNPRYLYMSDLHREALAHLLYGINSDGCLILLTGDVGTGKTTVCRCLLEQLPEQTDIALILNPMLTVRDLLKTICEELKLIPKNDIASIKTYIDTLNEHLIKSNSEGRSTAIIIDEAQNLDIRVLEQLRLLTNLETNTRKLLHIILIGQPELRETLARPELSQINQRITSRYHLSPLSLEDARAYILHRITVAGGSNQMLFSEKALKYAFSKARGIPRLINVLCDRALLGAYAENNDHVNLGIIKRAAKEVFPDIRKKKITGIAATLLALALAILLGLSFFFIYEKNLLELPIKTKDLQEQHSMGEKIVDKSFKRVVQNHNQPYENIIEISPPVEMNSLENYLIEFTHTDSTL